MAESFFANYERDLVNQIAERGIWVQDQVLSPRIVSDLLSEARKYYSKGYFRKARIGKLEKKQLVPSIRADKIVWLTQWDEKPLQLVQSVLQEIQNCARRELFLPIKRFEAHFSCYKTGDFYKTHVDRHQRMPGRVLSVVLYLNDLGESDGGELRIETRLKGDDLIVRPKAGRWVVFDSRLRHEVMTVNTERWSLTCWFRDDAVMGIEGI